MNALPKIDSVCRPLLSDNEGISPQHEGQARDRSDVTQTQNDIPVIPFGQKTGDAEIRHAAGDRKKWDY
ncbi:hypothetical protein JTE90_002647 [Oedothorax gibbosus]|uniref:Uncharacterized protein n=1 Tax=Oedothorax gibbosus TaxID=931172 RepID=A0AAV6U9I4_9ARAC|nr:hypothetical protein JTE90_002647 [Oedothorax gibbosus]